MESAGTAKARTDLEIALIRTMRDTLARVSEAAAFTWQQIERRPDGSATITFRRPKTDADTTAYLAPITVAALDAIRRSADDAAPVFGLNPGQIKRRIQAAAKAAGLEGVSSHGCRIEMAQDLARAKGIETPAIAGWRLEIGDDGSRVHRARERRPWRRRPFLRAGSRAVAAARLATGPIPRPRSHLYAALRDGPASAAPPARPNPERRPTGRPDAREAGNGFRSDARPRNPRDTPANGHIREAACTSPYGTNPPRPHHRHARTPNAARRDAQDAREAGSGFRPGHVAREKGSRGWPSAIPEPHTGPDSRRSGR